MTIRQLARFIESHSPARYEFSAGDDFIGVSTDVRYPDGTYHREIDVIPATLKAVRDWLGY